MPKLYETDFQSTGLRPTAILRTTASSALGVGRRCAESSNDKLQPCEHDARAAPHFLSPSTGSPGVEGDEGGEEQEDGRRGGDASVSIHPAPRHTSCVEGERRSSAAARSAGVWIGYRELRSVSECLECTVPAYGERTSSASMISSAAMSIKMVATIKADVDRARRICADEKWSKESLAGTSGEQFSIFPRLEYTTDQWAVSAVDFFTLAARCDISRLLLVGQWHTLL